jgi:hypothetical protein
VTSQFHCEDSIRRLAAIDPRLFEYTVECFTRREVILGPDKGVPMERVLATLQIARRYFEHIRLNYVVGLDPLATLEQWFARLKAEGCVDDVVATTMTPFSPAMEVLRVAECDSLDFVFRARACLTDLGLVTRRTGVEKSIFSV